MPARNCMLLCVKSLVSLFVLLTGLAPAQTAPQNPFRNDPQAVEAGRGAFRIYCTPCHGIRAEGGRGPDLTRGVYSAGETDAALFDVISNGVPGTITSACEAKRSRYRLLHTISLSSAS